MPNFKAHNYHQDCFLTINFEEQIQQNPFAYTIHKLIDDYIDLAAFYKHYSNDRGGRAAYDPALLLKVILLAYSKGITSSREIQWQCEHNILFQSLSCGTVPHFTGIAKFVSAYPLAIEPVFEQVLLVCDQQGLLGNELFAIDGCKMSSNAAKEHSGTLAELKQKQEKIRQKVRACLREHQKLDGRKRSDKVRKQQLAAMMETLEQEVQRIQAFLKSATPRMGQGKKPKEVKSNITDNESAKMKTSKGILQGYNGVAAVDNQYQVIVEAQAFGEGQEQHTLKPLLETIRERYCRTGISQDIYKHGVTVTADTGFSSEDNDTYLQNEGMDAYFPDTHFRSRDPHFKHQKDKHGKRHQDEKKGQRGVIPVSEFNIDTRRKMCIYPAGNEMWLRRETQEAPGKRKLFFEGKLTDCRECELNIYCMRNPDSANTREGHGRQVSITYTNGRTATDWMKRRVDSQHGKAIYSHRMSTVEPVFANIESNKGLRRFSLRGKAKVQGQWRLYCLVHNIEKIMNYGAIA